MTKIVAIVIMFTLLSGCLARLATDVVTAPIKVASKSVDVLTTSQSESDEKRGRELRKKEERLGKLSRERSKAQRSCDKDPSSEACAKLESINAEIDRLS